MGVLGALVSSELKQGLKWYRFRTFGQIQMQKVTWKFSIMRMECSRTESTLENALGLPTYYVTLQQRPSSGRGLNCISREPCKTGLSENTGLPMCEQLLLKTLPPPWGRGGPLGSACRRSGYADAYTIIVHFNSDHDPFLLSLGLACMTRFWLISWLGYLTEWA